MKVYLVPKALMKKVYLVLWTTILKGYYLLSVPVDIYIILHSRYIHKTYRMSELRKFKLDLKMYLNTRRISTLGTLDEVTSNIQRYGAIECCEFVKGWFKDTLPKLDSPILLAFIDVDLEASLHACVKYIWPNLVDQGYMFTDESVLTDYVALFYSEKWWRKYFNRTPPGLIGAGTGLPLGQHYIGPWGEGWSALINYPLQRPQAVAYTRKTMSGYWAYYPEDEDN